MFDTASSTAARRRLAASMTISIVTHAVTVAALFVSLSFHLSHVAPPPAEQHDDRIPVFIPEVVDGIEATEAPSQDSFAAVPPPVPLGAPAEQSKGLQIGFEGDSSGEQLLAVIRRFRAAVAFAHPQQAKHCDAGGPDMATECFYEHELTSPEWTHTVGRFPTGGTFLVRLTSLPAELRRLRSIYGIPADYVAYALLPAGMLLDVEDAIVEELKANGQESVVTATRVHLTFAVSSPRGFHIRIVATKPVSDGRGPASLPVRSAN